MKPEVYEALKIFEKRIQEAFPGAYFTLVEPVRGNDIGVELMLPVSHITRKERIKVAELAAEIEEECDVYIGTEIKPGA